jgi:hypothetical protein
MNAKSVFFSLLEFVPHPTPGPFYNLTSSSTASLRLVSKSVSASSSTGLPAGDYFFLAPSASSSDWEGRSRSEILRSMTLKTDANQAKVILFSDLLVFAHAVSQAFTVYEAFDKNCYYFAYHVYHLLKDLGIETRNSYSETIAKSKMTAGRCVKLKVAQVYPPLHSNQPEQNTCDMINEKCERAEKDMKKILADIAKQKVSTKIFFFYRSINICCFTDDTTTNFH